jgi:DNA-binding transcriptional LysR family regulator
MLDGLEVFIAVAEAQGFSPAAARLGVSPSAVSQAVKQLEARIGVALFSRTSRSVSLTEAGARYLARVSPAMSELALATDELAEHGARAAGVLRLNVSRGAYLFALQPVLKRFLDAYPDVSLEIVIDSALVDIVGDGFDAGIRFDGMVERDMVGLRVGPAMQTCIVATPDYLARRGTPRHPNDLAQHACLLFRYTTSGQLERWEFEKDGEAIKLALSSRLVLNDVASLVGAALEGLGLANLISGYADTAIAEGRLVRVLADWSPRLPPLMLYYPDRRRVPLKLRALIDLLRGAGGPAG